MQGVTDGRGYTIHNHIEKHMTYWSFKSINKTMVFEDWTMIWTR